MAEGIKISDMEELIDPDPTGHIYTLAFIDGKTDKIRVSNAVYGVGDIFTATVSFLYDREPEGLNPNNILAGTWVLHNRYSYAEYTHSVVGITTMFKEWELNVSNNSISNIGGVFSKGKSYYR